MKPHSYNISLRVCHPAMDPAEILAALQLEPGRSWRADEPRKTPKNTPLEGTWRDTYWTARVLEGNCPDKTLADALGELVNRFAAHKDFFQRIRSEGGKAEFYVGWFIDGNRGDEFDAKLLGKLADVGVNLSLDIYPPNNPKDDY